MVLKEMLSYAGMNGFSRALIFVAADNTASRRGVMKAGFQEFQVVRYLSILGIPFYRYSEPLYESAPPGLPTALGRPAERFSLTFGPWFPRLMRV